MIVKRGSRDRIRAVARLKKLSDTDRKCIDKKLTVIGYEALSRVIEGQNHNVILATVDDLFCFWVDDLTHSTRWEYRSMGKLGARRKDWYEGL